MFKLLFFGLGTLFKKTANTVRNELEESHSEILWLFCTSSDRHSKYRRISPDTVELNVNPGVTIGMPSEVCSNLFLVEFIFVVPQTIYGDD